MDARERMFRRVRNFLRKEKYRRTCGVSRCVNFLEMHREMGTYDAVIDAVMAYMLTHQNDAVVRKLYRIVCVFAPVVRRGVVSFV